MAKAAKMLSALVIVVACLAESGLAVTAKLNVSGIVENEMLEMCGACDRTQCPKTPNCNLGVVRDRCGCCEVCGLEQFQLCNLPDDWIRLARGGVKGYWHGRCGEGLECRLRKDVEQRLLDERQAVCYCKDKGVVCASDGNTYTPCKLRALQKASDGNLKKISFGPCKSEPKIIGHTAAMAVREGEHVSLACEVQGHPIPTIKWYFTPANDVKTSILLPGDADEISVSVRGGPQITRLTSHLQIVLAELKHEGMYSCLAENPLSEDMQKISLTVIPSPDRDREQESDWFADEM